MPLLLKRGADAGAALIGLFLGGLAIAAAVALVTAPITPRMATAQPIANPPPATDAPSLKPGPLATR